MKNYKKFTHSACEYFPCHKNVNLDKTENFNCLFCYCPLYSLGKKCGGNYIYTYGVKDCSSCLIPHSPEGFDYIMKKWELIHNLTLKNM
ncbi:MAG: metal-binding protein [Fusobacteria bacterium]|nr:metal-binding protein [Fusobacteriota bacterium]